MMYNLGFVGSTEIQRSINNVVPYSVLGFWSTFALVDLSVIKEVIFFIIYFFTTLSKLNDYKNFQTWLD